MDIFQLLKKGNKPSGLAALGNGLIAIIKGIAAVVSGSGAMFATTIHSAADTINQGLVYIGSALAEKEPTKRFPSGFGRVVNLFVLIAVIVISIMAYETIKTGWNLIWHPEASSGLWLNILILIAAIAVDGYILIKTMKQIVAESQSDHQGLEIVFGAFKNIGLSSPPTRLVFYEDLVATFGALVALVFVVLSHLTGHYYLDGIGTFVIGLLLIGIALKIGYDNTIGLIGVAAPKRIENRIAKMILQDNAVVDINKMRILKEGRQYHVEAYIELIKNLSLGEADDIKYRVRDILLTDPDVDDVTLGIIETDDKKTWIMDEENEKNQ